MDYLIWFDFFFLGLMVLLYCHPCIYIYKKKKKTLGRNKVDATYLKYPPPTPNVLTAFILVAFITFSACFGGQTVIFFFPVLPVGEPSFRWRTERAMPLGLWPEFRALFKPEAPLLLDRWWWREEQHANKEDGCGGAEMDSLHKHRHKIHPSYSNLDVLFSCLSCWCKLSSRVSPQRAVASLFCFRLLVFVWR